MTSKVEEILVKRISLSISSFICLFFMQDSSLRAQSKSTPTTCTLGLSSVGQILLQLEANPHAGLTSATNLQPPLNPRNILSDRWPSTGQLTSSPGARSQEILTHWWSYALAANHEHPYKVSFYLRPEWVSAQEGSAKTKSEPGVTQVSQPIEVKNVTFVGFETDPRNLQVYLVVRDQSLARTLGVEGRGDFNPNHNIYIPVHALTHAPIAGGGADDGGAY